MSRLETEQVVVGKHLKLKADGVYLDAHAGDDYIGAWLRGPDKAEFDDLGIFMRKGESPAIMLWAPQSCGFKLPFAFGGNGLQIPKQGGGVVIVPLEEISRMATLWECGSKQA